MWPLERFFLTLSNADVEFSSHVHTWRSYTTVEACSTTKWIELIGKEEFAAATLDPDDVTFLVQITLLTDFDSSIIIHHS